MHERTTPHRPILIVGALGLALGGCLRGDGGMIDTTVVDLSTGADSTGSSAGSSSGPGIMTTTYDPDHTTGTGDTSSGATGSTGATKPLCGDGKLDADEGEECDDGNDADTDECTSDCKLAACGDKFVQEGVEACDHGADNNDDLYGGCKTDCTWGPRCGDGILQASDEDCDDQDPMSGCLQTCDHAASCLEIKNSWADAASTGIHSIWRMNQELKVHCDMDADGGGYTILKYATKDAIDISAKQAETECSKFGMRLLAPRSASHIEAVFAVPQTLPPVGGGKDEALDKYAAILGIYPSMAGKSCVGKAFNSIACPEWLASGGGPFFVTNTSKSMTQPSTTNCAGCSMAYYWDLMSSPPLVTGYEAFSNQGKGATSAFFLCDVGDKQGP